MNKNHDFMARFSAAMESRYAELIHGNVDIAVGVSGGADSMALCYALSDFFGGTGNTLHALSVDHGLRPEAAEEARQVAKALDALPNVQHQILTWHHDEKPTARVQESARNARYDLMGDYMRDHNLSHLFLGHHMDDQAETFLFRLAKGSGLDGLGGMPYMHVRDDILLCRPFLDMQKSEIIDYCEGHNIDFINDPSNDSDDYARVRLRKSMDVLSVEGLTPKRLAVTAKRLLRVREAVDHIVEKEYKNVLLEKNNSRIVFNVGVLSENPFEIVLRVILKAMAELSPDRDYGVRLERAENLCEDLMKPKSFRKRTLGGVVFECNEDQATLELSREHKD